MDVGVFASLALDKRQLAKVVLGIEAAVAASFLVDHDRSSIIMPFGRGDVTQAEMKRRAEMCRDMFRELRGDLKWSVDRIIDQLPDMLRKRLDGEDWIPKNLGPRWWAGVT
jgi:hypothetical protein